MKAGDVIVQVVMRADHYENWQKLNKNSKHLLLNVEDVFFVLKGRLFLVYKLQKAVVKLNFI